MNTLKKFKSYKKIEDEYRKCKQESSVIQNKYNNLKKNNIIIICLKINRIRKKVLNKIKSLFKRINSLLEKNNYIYIAQPLGKKSMIRTGVMREIFNGKIYNSVVVTDVWNYKTNVERIDYLMSFIKPQKNNFIVFILNAFAYPDYVDKDLINAIRKKIKPNAIIGYSIDSLDWVRKQNNLIDKKINKEILFELLKPFDQIYSFDPSEIIYNVKYVPLPIYKFSFVKKGKDKPKVLFVGRNKGRLPLLIK